MPEQRITKTAGSADESAGMLMQDEEFSTTQCFHGISTL